MTLTPDEIYFYLEQLNFNKRYESKDRIRQSPDI